MSYNTVGNFDKCAAAYKQGYNLPGKRTPEFYRSYVNVLDIIGEPIEANRLAHECLKDNPNSATANGLMSYQYALDKNIKKAIELGEKSMKLLPPGPSPDRTRMEGALAKYYFDDKQWAQALKFFGPMAIRYPRDCRHHLWLGICLQHTGHPEEAMKELDKALSLGPHEKDVCLGRVRYFEDTHQYARGIDEANRMLHLVAHEADKDLLTLRCRLYELNGQKALANKDKAQLTKLESGLTDLFGPVH